MIYFNYIFLCCIGIRAQKATTTTTTTITDVSPTFSWGKERQQQQQYDVFQRITPAPQLLERWCLDCICQLNAGCPDHGCATDMICMYKLSKGFWIDGGKLKVKNTSDEEEAFESCVADKNCSEYTIQNYMKKYKRDCNDDGVINCEDYARIYTEGPANCVADWIQIPWENSIACNSRSSIIDNGNLQEDKTNYLTVGETIGVAISCIVIVAVVILIVFAVRRYKNRRPPIQPTPIKNRPPAPLPRDGSPLPPTPGVHIYEDIALEHSNPHLNPISNSSRRPEKNPQADEEDYSGYIIPRSRVAYLSLLDAPVPNINEDTLTVTPPNKNQDQPYYNVF